MIFSITITITIIMILRAVPSTDEPESASVVVTPSVAQSEELAQEDVMKKAAFDAARRRASEQRDADRARYG